MTTRDPRRWNNCHDKKQRAWNLPFLLLTAMFVWFSTSTSLAQIVGVFTTTPDLCEDELGTITCVSITGGTAPYSCSINCGSCLNQVTVWTNVEPGDYIATITDFNGLQATVEISVFTESEEEFLENYFYSDPLGKGYAAYALLNEFISFVPDPSVWESASNQTRSKKEPKVSADIEAAFAFPNPCENYTALRHESLEVHNATYYVRNITGVPVMQGELKKGNQSDVLDLDELPAGVYLVELTLDNARGTKYQQKLIKQ